MMNLRFPAPNAKAAVFPEPEWLKGIDSWRKALESVSQKPGKRRVHAMRVTTLRLQAPLEVWLRERAVKDAAANSARKWIKQAEKLRKLLSTVRDLDVLLDLTSTMQTQDANEVKAQSRAGGSCLRELCKLERQLQRRRAAAKVEFRRAIKKKVHGLDAAGQSLREVFEDSKTGKAIDASAALREAITGLVLDAPNLRAETLHDFRKRAKTARYLAEIVESYDPAGKRLVVMLKRIQTFAGDWHDMDTLAERAGQVLKPGIGGALLPLLRMLADRSLESALRETQAIAVKLAEFDGGPSTAPERKFPAQREGSGSTGLLLMA